MTGICEKVSCVNDGQTTRHSMHCMNGLIDKSLVYCSRPVSEAKEWPNRGIS